MTVKEFRNKFNKKYKGDYELYYLYNPVNKIIDLYFLSFNDSLSYKLTSGCDPDNFIKDDDFTFISKSLIKKLFTKEN